MKQEAEQRTETKYATVHNVYPSLRQARVKIQGSDEYITCKYPQNWKETPQWLRASQAVTLRHTGGNRGRLELIDHSLVRPSPQSGSSEPTIPTAVDAIINGLGLFEISERDVMKVAIRSGRVRFSGTTSSTIYLKMTASPEMVMGYGLKMGGVAEIVVIEAAPGSGARYDLVVVGSDLVFDVVKGTASSTPVFPDIPANHIQCGWVLVTDGTTEIKNETINKLYSSPIISTITIVADDSTLSWSELSTDLTVTTYDQYGNQIVGPGSGWYVTVTIAAGNGTVDDKLGNSSITAVSKYMGASATTTFGYTRDQASSDQSPTLQVSVSGSYVTAAAVIILLDATGDPM
jgi:hypothetical protein